MPNEEVIHRAAPADLEIRSGGDGRTIVGIACPYDVPTEIRSAAGGFTETFKRGAFKRSLDRRGPAGVKVLAAHNDRTLPIGCAQTLREEAAGLYAELRVSKTTQGDEVLELVRDGALDGLSVGFIPVQDQWSRDRQRVTRVEVNLREISVCPFPAYPDALIAAVRSDDPTYVPPLAVQDARLVLARLAPPISVLDAHRRLVSIQKGH